MKKRNNCLIMNNLYRYSNFNWVIETQYEQLDALKYFLNKTQGVSYKKGLSTSNNSNQFWFLGKGANFSNDLSYIEISKSISKIIKEKLIKYQLLFEDVNLKPSLCWTVTGIKGSFHKIHDHGLQNLICSIIYTKVPDIMEDEEGYVYFIMSNDIRLSSYKSIPKVIEIKPEVGKMIIFPSHMLHGVYPYPEGIRQSFNLDFLISNEKEYYQYD